MATGSFLEKNRTFESSLARKFVLIILLVGKEKMHSWQLSEKGCLAGRWQQLFFHSKLRHSIDGLPL